MGARAVMWYSRQGVILTVLSVLAETMKLESAVMVSCLVLNSCTNRVLELESLSIPDLHRVV